MTDRNNVKGLPCAACKHTQFRFITMTRELSPLNPLGMIIGVGSCLNCGTIARLDTNKEPRI